jgi:hypothetical protein
MKRVVVSLPIVVAIALFGSLRPALAQEVNAQIGPLERGQQYAGVPFSFGMVVEGFDESPQPEMPKLEIPGARVTPLGAPQPNVQQSIQIINGRRTESRRATWVFRWSIEIAKPGRVRIGPVTASQGSKRAVGAPVELELQSVPSTEDMKIELALPTRSVFVGETVQVDVHWMFTQEPDQPQFSIPLAASDAFTISAAPATDARKTLNLQIGGKELPVPYEVDQVDIGGRRMHRVKMHLYAAPRQAGKLELPAASVVAAFPVGRADFFGRAPTRLFRAADIPRSIDVKPLPETDKPPSFAGAVGSQFSIQVGTSRSVVQLGEPVELAITVKSDQRLDTLSLPRLDGPGGLPKDKFTVPAETPTGDLSDDAKTKTFKVTAQVVGPANEIPALAFSYFDPSKGGYQTIHSDPIAVSVKGGSIVGAGDVVASAPKKPGAAAQPDATDIALVGAELALSSPDAVDNQPFAGAVLWALVALLYLVPLGLFALRTWQVRTQGQREEAAEVKAARSRFETELARAAKDPARDTAGALVAALRTFAKTVGRDPTDDGGVAAKIETESFAPSAAASPLPATLRDEASDLVRRWTADAKRKRSAGGAASSGAAASIALVLLALPNHAEASGDSALAEGRKAYQEAMSVTDASARKAAFARAQVSLGEAAREMPGRPELLTDWGNAALGAGDVGTATLAYRRALAIDGATSRARRNLAWLHSRQSDALRPSDGTATDALLFFHAWPRSRRILVGAFAFAITILLLIPWRGRRRRGLAATAVLPAIVWLAMLASVLLQSRGEGDAVVMDAVVVRAADSAGAPAAFSQPLARGTEVTIVEQRDGWTRIKLANGTAGWVQGGAVERVTR